MLVAECKLATNTKLAEEAKTALADAAQEVANHNAPEAEDDDEEDDDDDAKAATQASMQEAFNVQLQQQQVAHQAQMLQMQQHIEHMQQLLVQGPAGEDPKRAAQIEALSQFSAPVAPPIPSAAPAPERKDKTGAGKKGGRDSTGAGGTGVKKNIDKKPNKAKPGTPLGAEAAAAQSKAEEIKKNAQS